MSINRLRVQFEPVWPYRISQHSIQFVMKHIWLRDASVLFLVFRPLYDRQMISFRFLMAVQRTNSNTNLCKMVVEEYFEMVPHATNRILLLAIMLVQLINRRQCCYRIHGTIERIQFLHLDIAQCQLNAPDNSSIHPVIHNRIAAICMTENEFKSSLAHPNRK